MAEAYKVRQNLIGDTERGTESNVGRAGRRSDIERTMLKERTLETGQQRQGDMATTSENVSNKGNDVAEGG